MKPVPERALLVYTVDKPVGVPADRVVAAVTAPPVESGNLEALLRRLLPTAPMPLPPPRSIAMNMELFLQRRHRHLRQGSCGNFTATPATWGAGPGCAGTTDRPPLAGTGIQCVFFVWPGHGVGR